MLWKTGVKGESGVISVFKWWLGEFLLNQEVAEPLRSIPCPERGCQGLQKSRDAASRGRVTDCVLQVILTCVFTQWQSRLTYGLESKIKHQPTKVFKRPRRMNKDYPMVLAVKNPLANAGDTRETGLIPGSGRSPWRMKWQPTPVFLPGKFHG